MRRYVLNYTAATILFLQLALPASPIPTPSLPDSIYPVTESLEVDPNIILDSDEDLNPPLEEDDTNVEDNLPDAAAAPVQPDVRKVLYDPNMNYGKGAPIPKPEPASTIRRNLIVLATTAVLATVGMLVATSNPGRDAPAK